MRNLPFILLSCCFLPLLGCAEGEKSSDRPPAAPVADGPKPKQTDLEPLFHVELRKIAQSYTTFKRPDGAVHWAPTFCRAPPPPRSSYYFSNSKDEGTHGRKLYTVFARNLWKGLYHVPGQTTPVGQAIVKESWVPEEDKGTEPTVAVGDLVRKGDRIYRPGRKADLFIMFKTDPATSATDEGWVYGTVTADGQKVTSAGRVQSCMKCHRSAPHDRLFGLPEK